MGKDCLNTEREEPCINSILRRSFRTRDRSPPLLPAQVTLPYDVFYVDEACLTVTIIRLLHCQDSTACTGSM